MEKVKSATMVVWMRKDLVSVLLQVLEQMRCSRAVEQDNFTYYSVARVEVPVPQVCMVWFHYGHMEGDTVTPAGPGQLPVV